MYISLEGGEGSGKSTTIQSLKSLYPDAIFVSEPGGTPLGAELKKTIFSQKRTDIADVYLFAAARAELIKTTVIPALAQGKLVITDRSWMSSLVYQGIVNGIGAETVIKANKEALQGITPDLYLFFRTSYKTSYERTHSRKDIGGEYSYYDNAGRNFFEDVDKAYMEASKKYPFIILDANKENEERVNDVRKYLML